MLTLCIDTAYKYLTVCLIKDDEIISSYSKECFKRQSENVFLALEEVFNKANINKSNIDSICISEGPGSYTGVRIGMTIAKTLCAIESKDLYVISTLRLYASNNPDTLVIMNARADRAYVGIYNNEEIILEDSILAIDKIDPKNYNVILDGSLINKEDTIVDIPNAFLKTKQYRNKIEDINTLVPKYLKESEDYYR